MISRLPKIHIATGLPKLAKYLRQRIKVDYKSMTPKTLLLLVLLILLNSYCFAQSKDPVEIIDTLYAENLNHGSIGYHIEANLYMGGVVPNAEAVLYVGDSHDQWTESNVSIRSYLSFTTVPVPENFRIESVSLLMYQRFCTGNGGTNNFPIWYENLYYPCMVAHVEYGNTLEIGDFYPDNVSDIGIISNNSINGLKQLDVTDAYSSDILSGFNHSQYMLYFHILSDFDNNADWITFDNAHTNIPGREPKLIIHYLNTTCIEDNSIMVTGISVFPNPVHSNISIKSITGSNLEKVELYNLKGQKIPLDTIETISSQESTIRFDRSIIPSGIYLLKSTIKSNNRIQILTKKVLLN